MSSHSYKKQEKGVKVANYEGEKEVLSELKIRGKEELKSLNNNIAAESELIEYLEKEREEALISEDQEEFQRVNDLLRNSQASLEFYSKRKEFLLNKSKIRRDELLSISKNLRTEQTRLSRDALKWAYEDLEGVMSVLSEVERELKEGDSLLIEAISMFKESHSENEFLEASKYIPGVLNEYRFPEGRCSDLLKRLREMLSYQEQDSIQNMIDDEMQNRSDKIA